MTLELVHTSSRGVESTGKHTVECRRTAKILNIVTMSFKF